MKTIKIHINRLGAVRNSVVELKPLMIFSGESGVGKSYVAILVHYFYKVLAENRLQAFFSARGWDYDTLVSKNPDESSFSFTTPMLLDWITEGAKTYMRESLGNPDMEVDVTFEIPISRNFFTFSYRTVQIDLEGKAETSRVFELGDLNVRIDGDAKSIGSLPWSLLMQAALRNDLLEGLPLDQTFAMVPGRGALLTLPVTMQERIRNNGDIYSEFLTDWSVVQSMRPHKNTDRHLLERLSYINGGSIDIDDNERVIYRMLNGQPMPIAAAASSIKELAPLYILLDKYPSNHLSILFEEPEDAGEGGDDDDELDFSLVSDDNTIALSDALLSSLVMETPFVVLCRPDCKGLCPVCGANLNEEDCGHAAQMEEERLKASPFAVLASLDLGHDEDGSPTPGSDEQPSGSTPDAE